MLLVTLLPRYYMLPRQRAIAGFRRLPIDADAQ